MKKLTLTALILIFLMSLLQMNCSVPHRVLPQKDIQPGEINEPTLDKRVLIASRFSEFKQEIIDRIKEVYQDKPVYLKIIGLEDVKKEDANTYSAVVLINKCMAWQMDRNVNAYLKRYDGHKNFIVFTTSGDGNWLPKMEERNFDAISSASEIAKVDEVASQIINKINILIGNP
jgi:hypothetical protein